MGAPKKREGGAVVDERALGPRKKGGERFRMPGHPYRGPIPNYERRKRPKRRPRRRTLRLLDRR